MSELTHTSSGWFCIYITVKIDARFSRKVRDLSVKCDQKLVV